MARILFSAYACEPDKGSEPAVGWNWAVESAQLGHQVWVLTRSNNHRAIESHDAALLANLHFLYFDLPKWMQRTKHLTGDAGVLLYYLLWQWFASAYVRKRFPGKKFDVVHHVTFASVHSPSFLAKLGTSFYYGPVGGGETVPSCLSSSFRLKEKMWERVRRASNHLVRLNPLMRRVFRQATVIFVTPSTLPLIPERYRSKCRVQLAVGSPRDLKIDELPSRCIRRPARLLYVGRLLDSKGIEVVIRALRRIRGVLPDTTLTVVGDGPSRTSLMKLCARLQLSSAVNWRGWLSHRAVHDQYCSHDVLVFPAMRDSGGMVVLEALAHSMPVVCPDLGGPGVIVNESCGRVIPTTVKDNIQLADCFAEALLEVLRDAELYMRLSRGAAERAREFDFRKIVASVHGLPIESVLFAPQVER